MMGIQNQIRAMVVGGLALAFSAAVVPAEANLIISGGNAETIGVTCSPCVGGTGIPLNTVGVNSGTLLATPGETLIYHYLGSDAGFHNQFFVSNDDAGNVNNPNYQLVFDNKVASTWGDKSFTVPSDGVIDFKYIWGVDGEGGGPVTVPNGLDPEGNIFLGPVTPGSPPFPQVYIGLADGHNPGSGGVNNDHQDLGALVSEIPKPSEIPEPSTWLLMGTGFLGVLGYGWRRSKQTA